MCVQTILTQKTYRQWLDRVHSEADRPEYTNSILWIFTEKLAESPTMATGPPRRLTLGARVQPKAWQTLLKHPFRTTDSVSPLAICLCTREPLKTNTELREYLLKQSVSVAMIPHSVHLNKSHWARCTITLPPSSCFSLHPLHRHPFSPMCPQDALIWRS